MITRIAQLPPNFQKTFWRLPLQERAYYIPIWVPADRQVDEGDVFLVRPEHAKEFEKLMEERSLKAKPWMKLEANEPTLVDRDREKFFVVKVGEHPMLRSLRNLPLFATTGSTVE